jgi:hypothetical protein
METLPAIKARQVNIRLNWRSILNIRKDYTQPIPCERAILAQGPAKGSNAKSPAYSGAMP